MDEDNVVSLRRPDDRAEDPLTEVLRHGARTLLAQAIEAEVAAFLATHAGLVDETGRRARRDQVPIAVVPRPFRK
jgi:hypothetical protein